MRRCSSYGVLACSEFTPARDFFPIVTVGWACVGEISFSGSTLSSCSWRRLDPALLVSSATLTLSEQTKAEEGGGFEQSLNCLAAVLLASNYECAEGTWI